MTKRKPRIAESRVVSTVGHGSRSLEEFVAMLEAFGVTRVVDIRKMPRSRANPQFNHESLPASLGRCDIAYTHMPGLTGLRKPAKQSVNGAWRSKSFRAFADYMQTSEFAASIDALIDLTEVDSVALMCAETVPWRCHRSLVADALVARGVAVRHLMTDSQARPHTVPEFARRDGTWVYYP